MRIEYSSLGEELAVLGSELPLEDPFEDRYFDVLGKVQDFIDQGTPTPRSDSFATAVVVPSASGRAKLPPIEIKSFDGKISAYKPLID